MSNPAAHTDVSVKPAKYGVTTATSAADQQADVERKLKLYGVIKALSDGRMPSNKQIDEALSFAIGHSPVQLSKLSPDGKLMIEDVRDILESLRMMVKEKNDGELFQNFVYATSKGDITRGKKSKNELTPVSKEDATADAKQAAAHLRVLLTLFATNSEARKLLSDVGLVSRDLFATAASKAAEKARPDEDALNQVDKSAPSGEWIGPDGKKVGKNETPELQMKLPGGREVRMHPKDDPADAKLTDADGNTRTAGEAKDQAQSAYAEKKEQAQSAKEDAKSQGQGALDSQGGVDGLKQQARDHAEDIRTADDPMAAAKDKKEQAKGAANEQSPDVDSGDAKASAKNKISNAIPQEHKDKAKEQLNKTKDFLDDNFPEERRDNFIYRLKKVVVECQEHDDYQEAMTFFLDTAENYKGAAKHVAAHGADSAGSVAEDPAYNNATLMFRTLLERFANNRSMQPLIDAIDDMYSDAANDSELREFYHELNDYIRNCLLNSGYILEDESTERGKRLQEKGKSFFTEKYKGHFDNFGNQVQYFFSAMGDDPLNQRLGEDFSRLVKDLLFNSEGDLEFKPRLWNDIRKTILPTLIQQIGYVPIPRAEYQDDKIELVLENLVLQGTNLFPNIIELEAFNHFKFSPYDNITDGLSAGDNHHHSFTIGLEQIHADLRDVQFAFKKRKGFPKLSDSGLADVFIGGTGISVRITVESVEGRRDTMLRVKDIKTDIGTMKISLRETKHDLIYKLVKSLSNNLIKKAIESAIKLAIKVAVENLDNQLTEVRNKMEDAKKQDDTTRTEALKNLYARKKQTAKENAAKADEKTGTFKIVTSQEDSIVKDLDSSMNKNSWSKRQFKVEDVATSGKDWTSPAFDLFSGKHPAVSGEAHPVVKQSGSAI